MGRPETKYTEHMVYVQPRETRTETECDGVISGIDVHGMEDVIEY